MVSNAQPVEVAGTLPEDYLPQLKDLIDTAWKQSPTMMLQNINLAVADAGRIRGEVAFWPSLSGSASYASNSARVDSGTSSTSTSSGAYYGINLSQQIFAWGANKATADVAKLQEQIIKRQWVDAFRTLAGSLRSQYLALINQKIALRNSIFQLQLVKADLATQEEMLKDGTISAGAINGARLSVQEQSLWVDKATQSFAHARRMFAHLAGLEDLTEESIPSEIPHPDPSLDKAERLLNTFIHGGIENTLQGQVYAMELKQTDLNYWITRTDLYPKFSFGAGYSLSNSQSAGNGTVSQSAVVSYSYGINGSWTIFNGFSTRANKIGILATKRSQERQFKSYIDDTTETVIDNQKQLGFAAQAMDIAEQHLALAKDGYNRANTELQEGTVAKVAVDSIRGGFYATEYAASAARADYLSRWADFVSLVGADPILNKVPAAYLNSHHGH